MRTFRGVSFLLVATWLAVAPNARAGWPETSKPPPGAVGGGDKDSAVIIGLEKYVAVPGVPGATRNADDWYQYFVNTLKVPVPNVHLLRDSEATAEKIRKFTALAAAEVKPGGTAWLIFVGHGAPAMDGKDGVLVGFDAQQDADSLYARSVPQGELLKLLSKNPKSRAVAVVDACFSGRTGSGQELVKGLQPLIAVRKEEKAVQQNVLVLSAGRADQFAGPLPGGTRPAFSYLVLGALRGWGDKDNDGFITAQEVVDHAGVTLATVVKDRTQTPEVARGDATDILAKSGQEQGPDLAAIVLGGPRSGGSTSSASGSRSGGSTDILTVAVSEFRGAGLPPDMQWLAKSFPDALLTRLSRGRQVRVVEREFLEQIVAELKLQSSSMIDERSAVQAGRLLGAKVFVFGSLAQVEGDLLARARLVSVENGEVLTVEEAQGPVGKIFGLQADLGRKISTALSLEQALAEVGPLERTELSMGTYVDLDRLRLLAKPLPLFGLDAARARKGGEYQLALSTADRLVSSYPKLAPAHYFRGLFSLHSEAMDVAEQESVTVLRLSPEDPDAYLLRANVQQVRNDTAGARATLGELTKKFPTDARGWYFLGRVLQRDGLNDTAALYLLAALERSPFIVDAETNLRTLVVGPDGARVIATIQAQDPRLMPAAASYRAFWKNERRQLGSLATNAMSQTPSLYIGFLMQAMLAKDARRPSDAQNLLLHALALRPNSPETHRELGLSLLESRNCGAGAAHIALYRDTASFVDDYSELMKRVAACR